MYGLIGRMKAVPGQRDALIAIMLGHGASMAGCLSYVVARDRSDPDGVWVSEVWDSPESHKASLELAAVRDAISSAMPLIAGYDTHIETDVAGGIGLAGQGADQHA